MKKHLLLAALAFMLFLIPGVLGALDITASSPVNAQHNSVISIPFTLENTHPTITVQNLVIKITDIANPSNELDVTILDPAKESIAPGAIVDYTIDDYSIPKHFAAGTYAVTITVSGDEGGTPITSSKTINIVVSQSKTWDVYLPTSVTTSPGTTKSTTFKISNTGNVDLTGITIGYNESDPELEDNDGGKISLSISPTSVSKIQPGESATITVEATVPSDMDINEYDPVITVRSAEGLSKSEMFIISVRLSFCEQGDLGTRIEMNILEPDTGDDFYPGDTIPIDVKVKNKDNDDSLDFIIVADLYDLDNDEWLDEEVELDESLDEDDSETFSLDYQIPLDVSKGNDYRLYVKVYEDGNEDEQCKSQYVTIDIKQNTHEVKIDKVESPESVTCDSIFDLSARLFNIGTKDEDDVKLQIINSELGINEERTIGIDKGDKETVTLPITIPKDAAEKTYTFTIKAFFYYSSSTYHDSVSTTQQIKVEGNCVKEESQETAATLSAEVITSKPTPGEQVTLKLTVFNTGNLETAYTIAVEGYEGWASLDKVEPLVLTLDKNKASSAYIYLTPNEDAIGTHTVTVKALFNGKKAEKDIALEVKEKETTVQAYQSWATRISNLSGFDLATINVILIIGIIIIIAWVLRVRRAY